MQVNVNRQDTQCRIHVGRLDTCMKAVHTVHTFRQTGHIVQDICRQTGYTVQRTYIHADRTHRVQDTCT
jgi:hypothetical protein